MILPRIRTTAIAVALFFTSQLWAQNASNPIQVALLRWYQANQIAQFSGDGSCTEPNGIAFDGAHIWVACSTANEIQELNASDGALLRTIHSDTQLATPQALLFDGANVWVSNGSTGAGAVTKVNASTGALSGPFSVGSGPYGMAFDGTSLWIANYHSNDLSKVASNGAVTPHIPLTNCTSPLGLAFDRTYIWVSCGGNGTIQQVNSDGSQHHAPVTVGPGAFNLAFDGSNIWVTCNNSSVYKVNISSYVAAPITVGSDPFGVAFDSKYVWVANYNDGSVTKILASSGAVIQTYIESVGAKPTYIAFDGGNIWVANSGTNVVAKF